MKTSLKIILKRKVLNFDDPSIEKKLSNIRSKIVYEINGDRENKKLSVPEKAIVTDMMITTIDELYKTLIENGIDKIRNKAVIKLMNVAEEYPYSFSNMGKHRKKIVTKKGTRDGAYIVPGDSEKSRLNQMIELLDQKDKLESIV